MREIARFHCMFVMSVLSRATARIMCTLCFDGRVVVVVGIIVVAEENNSVHCILWLHTMQRKTLLEEKR